MHLNLNDEQYAEDLTIIMKPMKNPKKRLLTYMIKGIFQTVMSANIFFCPFEDVEINFSVLPHAYSCRFLNKLGHVKINPMGRYADGDKYQRQLSVFDMLNLKDRTSHCEYILRKDKCKVEIAGNYGTTKSEDPDVACCGLIKRKKAPMVKKLDKEMTLKQFRKQDLEEHAKSYK